MIVAVIGLGIFGARTATRLSEKGAEVIAIDKNHDLVEKIKERVTHAVSLDVTDERALRAVTISDVDVAVVAIGENIEASLLAVAMLRKMGVGRVIARATTSIHEQILKEIGASEIIKVEEEMGEIMASQIIAPHVLQRYNFAAGYSIVEIRVMKKWIGKSLLDSKIRLTYSLNIVALQKRVPYITEEGKAAFRVEINDSPAPSDVIGSDDILVLVGSDKSFNKLFVDMSQN